MEKSQEILSQEVALHRILFNSDDHNNPTIRLYRFKYKNNVLNPNIVEKILMQYGYKKVETSKWTK